MQNQQINQIKKMFSSRLMTLRHLVQTAELKSKEAGILLQGLAADMHPFGTQIAFTCNQPLSFAQWCTGRPNENFDPQVSTFTLAGDMITQTEKMLESVDVSDDKLSEIKHLELGPSMYADLPGHVYVNDFLIPNFYFHLTTAYGILRMTGVQIGKRDFMLHLMPHVRQDARS